MKGIIISGEKGSGKTVMAQKLKSDLEGKVEILDIDGDNFNIDNYA